MIIWTSDELRLRARGLKRGLFSPTVFRGRHFDGFTACMPHSGTHWLKYMLGLTLARLHDLPPPAHIEDNSIIGHPQSPPIYPGIPRIVTAHSIPNYMFRSRMLFRLMHFPRYVVLVRDLRDVSVADFEKGRYKYNVDFSTFLRGIVRGEKYWKGLWRRIEFLNGWGAVVERQPERVAVLKYEDLVADTRGQLARVCEHFNIKGVTPELLGEVVADSSKTSLANIQDANAMSTLVRMDARPIDEWFSAADRRFVAELCRRNLKHTFGYEY